MCSSDLWETVDIGGFGVRRALRECAGTGFVGDRLLDVKRPVESMIRSTSPFVNAENRRFIDVERNPGDLFLVDSAFRIGDLGVRNRPPSNPLSTFPSGLAPSVARSLAGGLSMLKRQHSYE
mgnify:CR=1 FL=1